MAARSCVETSSTTCTSIWPTATSRVDGVPDDEERLTRDDITSTVHYLKFPFDAAQRELARRRSGAARGRPPRVPRSSVELTDEQRAELAGDFA